MTRISTFKRPSVGVGVLKPKRSRGADAAEWRLNVIASTRWKKYSEQYRRRHHCCVMCWAEGRLGPVEVVHHLPEGRTPETAFDERYLVPLCSVHHNQVTAREMRGQVKIPRAEPVEVEDHDGHYG